MLCPISKGREATLQKFRSFIFCAFFAVCCLTQTASGSTAGEQASGKESWQRVGETVLYRSNAPTKVTVVGNSVLVPVTLVHQGNQMDVQLLLDTGSTSTVINTEIADQLNIQLNTAKKARVRVVGGAVIEAFQVMLSRITVGPNTKEDQAVFVIPHKGPASKHDGLLGMDVLRGLKYSIDFDRQLIIWQ
jgi:clan AA aspartic protease (TIGR02281 family)